MPYSKEHKAKSRERILQSAYQLFATRGFNQVTIDEVMQDCSLTRGAFYAHFISKSDLYSEVFQFGVTHSFLTKPKPEQYSNAEWLLEILCEYLSIKHVCENKACPLAFLINDIVAQDEVSRKVYASSYKRMNETLSMYLVDNNKSDSINVSALTAMLIGTIAISRTMDDQEAIQDLLFSSRKQAAIILGLEKHMPKSFQK